MPSEEVEDEILALESIYEDQFSRTGDNQIRAIVRPEEESEGPSKLEGVYVMAACVMDLSMCTDASTWPAQARNVREHMLHRCFSAIHSG